MSAIEQRIKELVSFAQTHDGADRTLIFQSLIDLFLSADAPIKNPTRKKLIDIISALIPHVEADSRRAATSLVSTMQDPPLDLALALARDRASIAGPILQKVAFDEDQLIELIEQTGRDHHQQISSRTDLSANIWIALARGIPRSVQPRSTQATALWDGKLFSEADDSFPENRINRAKLRILRTDDALKSPGHSCPDHAGSASNSDGNASAARSEKIKSSPQTETPTKTEPLNKNRQEHTPPIKHKAPNIDFEALNAHLYNPIGDPGSKGWSWRSDRDGFITSTSDNAAKYMNKPKHMIVGEATLDLLDLNTKLDHPITRALQRRSTIHNAPLFLSDLEKSHQYWILNAQPIFNNENGSFEGYEGNLNLIKQKSSVEQKSNNNNPAPEKDRSIQKQPFLENIEPEHADITLQRGTSKIGYSNKVSDDKIIPLEANCKDLLFGKDTSNPKTDFDPLRNVVSKSTADTVQDVIESAFSTLEEANNWAQKPSPDRQIKPLPNGTNTPSIGQKNSQIFPAQGLALFDGEQLEPYGKTLQHMEQSLSDLVMAVKKQDSVLTRLKAEMAGACLRVLKEQLDAQNEDSSIEDDPLSVQKTASVDHKSSF